jgi:hypothetical protein
MTCDGEKFCNPSGFASPFSLIRSVGGSFLKPGIVGASLPAALKTTDFCSVGVHPRRLLKLPSLIRRHYDLCNFKLLLSIGSGTTLILFKTTVPYKWRRYGWF